MRVKSLGRKLWKLSIAAAVASAPAFAADPMAPCGLADEDAIARIAYFSNARLREEEAHTVVIWRPTDQRFSFTKSIAQGMEDLGLAPGTETHCEFILEAINPDGENPRAHVRIFKVGKRGTGDPNAVDAIRSSLAESKREPSTIEWIKRGPEFKSEEKLVDAGSRAPAAAGLEERYLAMATSPSAGTRIRPGESGYFGIGWHTESHHDAGKTAEAEWRGAVAASAPSTGTRTRSAPTSWRVHRFGMSFPGACSKTASRRRSAESTRKRWPSIPARYWRSCVQRTYSCLRR